jgi:hypothetical protein
LNLEFPADELVQVHTARDHIAPRRSRRAIVQLQCSAELIENIERKETDLTFVIILEIEVTISANPTPRDTFDRRQLDHGTCVRLATVVANKIVAWGNVKVADFHCAHDNIEANRFT